MFKESPGGREWNVGILVLLVVLLSLRPPPAVLAAAIVVNSTADTSVNDGQCTLREAIVAANTDTASGGAAGECAAGVGEDTIDLAGLSGTIELASALPPLEGNVGLNGPGAGTLAIRRGTSSGDYRILEVESEATVTLSGLTLGNGHVPAGQGGGLLNRGTLTLSESVVSNNSAYDGGGIHNEGTITLDSCTVRDNEAIGGGSFAAEGGGIYNLGVLKATNSILHANQATDLGGGIYNGRREGEVDPTVRLTNSSVIGNTAMHGGGILNDSGLVELVHSTVSGNSAISVGEFGGVGGGIRNFSGRVVSKSSLIAENTASSSGADCLNAAELLSVGYNLVGDANGCDWPLHEHDLVNVAPLLGPLQDNGGPTETRALLIGSPAFDAIPVGDCTDISDRSIGADQRGISRPQGVGCDIGAYEAQTAELSVVKRATEAQVNEGESAVFRIEVNNDGPLEATGLVISDVLPIGLTFASSAASQGTYANSTGEWSVGDLSVGLGAILVLTSTADTGTTGTVITNVAAIAHVGQFDSDRTDNRDAAAVVVSAPRTAYLPSILMGHTPPATFPIFIGPAIAIKPIRYQGQVFYTSQGRVPDSLPLGGAFYLSAQPYILTKVLVDDELVLFLGAQKIFSFDFSTSGLPVPAVVEMPRSLLEQAVGKNLSAVYRDVYGDVYQASEMWLIWVP